MEWEFKHAELEGWTPRSFQQEPPKKGLLQKPPLSLEGRTTVTHGFSFCTWV